MFLYTDKWCADLVTLLKEHSKEKDELSQLKWKPGIKHHCAIVMVKISSSKVYTLSFVLSSCTISSHGMRRRDPFCSVTDHAQGKCTNVVVMVLKLL